MAAPPATRVSSSSDGLTVTAHRGAGSVLLAFDLDQQLAPGLAGFAVERTPPGGTPEWLLNRLSFTQHVTAATTPAQRVWTPTNVAPLQRFHWLDLPVPVAAGSYGYRVVARMFAPGSDDQLVDGPETSIALELEPGASALQLGFTRGYLSSQAYAREFGNAPIRPAARSIDYDTAPFAAQYAWLGGDARRLVLGVLDECVRDPGLHLDLFAFDLDEPDVIRGLVALGPRLRAFLDDARLHVKPGALERDARAALTASAGAANVRTGHFGRFAHDKVMVVRRDGAAVKVLTGSANFSVRGLYVQANNVLVFDDAEVAALYGQAFDQAFTDPHGFSGSAIAARWFEVARDGLPPLAASFAPHRHAAVSLDRLAAAVEGATSSVLFAIMELGGGGPLMTQIDALQQTPGRFFLGMTQRTSGSVVVRSPRNPAGVLVPFAFLKEKVPAPFSQEVSGGAGQVIHHKFLVTDFNDAAPQVFTGSSNLAAGGEEQNGDNLLAIADRDVATAFAVEAVRLVDHYAFRAAMHAATDAQPLRLRTRAEGWAAPFYEPGSYRSAERTILVR